VFLAKDIAVASLQAPFQPGVSHLYTALKSGFAGFGSQLLFEKR